MKYFLGKILMEKIDGFHIDDILFEIHLIYKNIINKENYDREIIKS